MAPTSEGPPGESLHNQVPRQVAATGEDFHLPSPPVCISGQQAARGLQHGKPQPRTSYLVSTAPGPPTRAGKQPGVEPGYSIDFSTADKISKVGREVSWAGTLVSERRTQSGDIESQPEMVLWASQRHESCRLNTPQQGQRNPQVLSDTSLGTGAGEGCAQCCPEGESAGDNRCGQRFYPMCLGPAADPETQTNSGRDKTDVYSCHLEEAWQLPFPAHVVSKVGSLGTGMWPSSCCNSVLAPSVAAQPSLHVQALPGFRGGFQRLPDAVPAYAPPVLTARRSGKCISHSGGPVSTQKLAELSLKKTGGVDTSVML